jgi:hypothetical protein
MGRWVVTLLLAGLAGNAAAQPPASAGKWGNVTQLALGTEIRLALSGGRTVRGKLQNATSDAVAIQEAARQETLPRTDIKSIQLRGKGRRGRNALIGIAIGAGAGLAIGAAVDSHDKASFDNFLPNAGKAIFTPVGAIIGAIVGVAIPAGGWREIYRAP